MKNTRVMPIKCFVLAAVLALACGAARAKVPDGWTFVDFNQAVRVAQRTGKPLFIYFGFATCQYCDYANRHTFSFESLRRRYTEHYVLAYFDIRGDPNDPIVLPGGEKLTRAEAIKRFKGSPVPAWMFMAPDGREILMRRGSRTKVDAFMKFDLYVASGAYRQASFESFLAARGLREEAVD